MPEITPPHGCNWAFVALEYYALILNRIYIVLVGNRTLAGAYMGGPVAALPFPAAAWQPGFWLSEKRLRRYSGIHIESPEFRWRHWANFQHERNAIIDVQYDARPKWGMASVPYSGRIHVEWQDGRKRELILLGRQDGPSIRDRLAPSASHLAVGADGAVPAAVFDGLWPLPVPNI